MHGRQILKKRTIKSNVFKKSVYEFLCLTSLLCIFFAFHQKMKILTSFDFSKMSFFFCGTEKVLIKVCFSSYNEVGAVQNNIGPYCLSLHGPKNEDICFTEANE